MRMIFLFLNLILHGDWKLENTRFWLIYDKFESQSLKIVRLNCSLLSSTRFWSAAIIYISGFQPILEIMFIILSQKKNRKFQV